MPKTETVVQSQAALFAAALDRASGVLAHDCTDGDHWPCTAVTSARNSKN